MFEEMVVAMSFEVLVPIVIGTAVVLIFLLFHRSSEKRIKTIIDGLGFKGSKFYLSSRLKFSAQGETFILDFSDKNLLKLHLPLPTPLGLTVRKKVDVSPIFLQKEIKTNQADFDHKFTITTNHEREATLLFQEAEARHTIEQLFSEWVTEIDLDGQYLTAKVATQTEANPSSLKEIPTGLLKLKNLLQKKEGLTFGKAERPSILVWYLIYGLPVLCALAQIAFAVLLPYKMKKDFSPVSAGQLILITGLIFLPLIFLYLFLAFRIAKNRPAATKKFFVSFILATFWFVSALPFIQGVNGYFDRSLPRKVEYYVTAKVPGKQKSFIILLLQSKPVKKPSAGPPTVFYSFMERDTIKLSVKREEYLKAKPYLNLIIAVPR